jgi:hypothetical protein
MAGSTFDRNATVNIFELHVILTQHAIDNIYLQVEDGVRKLGLPDINTRLPGMAIKLLPHQVLGVAWMLERERHKYDNLSSRVQTSS